MHRRLKFKGPVSCVFLVSNYEVLCSRVDAGAANRYQLSGAWSFLKATDPSNVFSYMSLNPPLSFESQNPMTRTQQLTRRSNPCLSLRFDGRWVLMQEFQTIVQRYIYGVIIKNSPPRSLDTGDYLSIANNAYWDIMASGFGRHRVGRCYNIFSTFEKCMVSLYHRFR